MTSKPRFTPQFKGECIEYALKKCDKTLVELAEKFWIGKSTLSTWVNQHQLKHGSTSKRPLTEEQKQIAQLKKEVAHLQEVNEILKNRPTRPAASLVNRNFCGVSFEECRILAASFLEVSIPSKNLVWG